jgi:hypothetical protein
LALSLGYYTALARQLSPKEVFETYATLRKGQEPIALLGVGGRSSAYYAGGQPTAFSDAPAALQWLVGDEKGRRFLAVNAEELPRLNSLYRAQRQPAKNIPVFDTQSSQVVLVGSVADETGPSKNPLEKFVLSALPAIQRPLDINFDDKLRCHGIEIVDASGRRVDAVSPGRKYTLKTYYEVLQPIGSEWEAFIHIDGYRRRHNGDHKPLGGKYPMVLWGKGDIVVDEHVFSLEPNFSPGAYTIFFGLFSGETRMKVTSGPADNENRVNAGALRVQ